MFICHVVLEIRCSGSNEGPDQMVCPVASDLDLQCLLMPYEKDMYTRLGSHKLWKSWKT